MKWTQADDHKLMDLWAKGLAISKIARDMGRTRGSVAGRKKKLADSGIEFVERESPFSVAAPPPPPPFVEHDNGVDYMALGYEGCKAILDRRGSDGLPMCCGKLRHRSGPYCSRHTAQYHNPNYMNPRGRQHG